MTGEPINATICKDVPRTRRVHIDDNINMKNMVMSKYLEVRVNEWEITGRLLFSRLHNRWRQLHEPA